MSAQPAQTFPLSPLDEERAQLLARVVDGLDASSLQWISGFTAGIAFERGGAARSLLPLTSSVAPAIAPAAKAEPSARLTIVYGSQTGNGKRIAERRGRTAEASGLTVRVYSASSYPVKDLARERLLVVVMSTHGDGDPPDDARSFIEHLQGKRAPKL